MNLDQAADFLCISRITLNRWMRLGLLADVCLVGGHFERALLEDWARRHDISTREPSEARTLAQEDLLAGAVLRGAAVSADGLSNAREAIEVAITALDLAPATEQALRKEILGRERLAGTALGFGIAVPHPRRPQSELFDEPQVCVLYLDPPLDWAATDGQLVHTAILVLSPSTPVHLQILARIAYAVRVPGFIDYLMGRPDRAELAQRLSGIRRDG